MSNFRLNITKNVKSAVSFNQNFDKPFLQVLSPKLSIYIFGQINYINLKKKIRFNKLNKAHINYLKKNILKFNNYKRLEGTYCFVIVLKNLCYVVSDYNKSYEVFYSKKLNNFWISSRNEFKNINNNIINFNQISLANILNVYGNYPFKKDTIFENVSRLNINEFIKVDFKNFKILIKKINEKFLQIDNKIKIDDYKKSLFNSINLSSSKSMNWILMSSGWDSSSILAILSKFKKSSKITAVIGRVKFSNKYGYINQTEIEKAKKICAHYRVRIKVINVDYNSSLYLKKFNFYKQLMKNNELYSLISFTPIYLSEYISKNLKSSQDIVFSGDVSDGAHNFGFSQYATFLNHSDLGFREYFDKIHTYFFSPSFFSKVIKNTYKNDYLFDLVKNLKNIKLLDDTKKNKLKNYLIPLFLSQNRFPFEDFLNNNFLKNNGKKIYEMTVFNNYFKNFIQILNKKNLYSVIIRLYNCFHWQSTQVRCTINAPRFFNIKTCVPFRDQNVLNFLSKMPENWGRGLELRPTKYPLKKILEDKKLNYPFQLQLGPHSYLYDTDPNWNPKYDILYYSKARFMYKSKLKKLIIKNVFDKKIFNLEKLEKLKINYIKNKKKENGRDLETLFNLTSLSTIIDG
jgi:hypothetical protein